MKTRSGVLPIRSEFGKKNYFIFIQIYISLHHEFVEGFGRLQPLEKMLNYHLVRA